MRFYRVVIACWSQGARRPDMREFIVEAVDADNAMEIGRQYAERTALFGAKWVKFETRSAISITLPWEIPAP